MVEQRPIAIINHTTWLRTKMQYHKRIHCFIKIPLWVKLKKKQSKIWEWEQKCKCLHQISSNFGYSVNLEVPLPWWRHQMEACSALLAICAGNSPVPGEFPAQRPVTQSFDVFFDLRLNKRLRKQSCGWWFETLSRPLWRHRNGNRSLMKFEIQCGANGRHALMHECRLAKG